MTQEPYTVSILVPVYGVEKYIERCARSIFEQTYKNLDIVFVDDCTPDKSIEILRRVLDDYPERKAQTRIIRHEHNRGLAAARNTAVAAATGTFLTHLDSDDWLELDAVEELVKKQVETGAEIVTGEAYVDENTIDEHYIEPNYKNKDEMMVNILSQIWHHEIWNRLIKKSLYDDHHLLALERMNQGEDWRMTPMLLWYANGIARLDKKTYHYYMNDQSMCKSEKSWKKKFNSFVQNYNNYSSLVPFFADKNNSYHELTRYHSLKKCYDLMIESSNRHDRGGYYKCRREILAKYMDLLVSFAGSKISMLLKFPFSYSLIKLYSKIGTFLGKVILKSQKS